MTDKEQTAKPRSGEVVVSFEHKFFSSFEDIYFRLTEHTEEPVAVVRLSGADAVLAFPGIRREFALTDDTADGRMLGLIAAGLKFVKGLRVGDPVPKEVLTREASWEVEPRHRDIAYHRLTLQMVTWLSGDEHLITDPEQLQQIAEDPTTKKKVNDAFDEIAEKLGIGRERREEVIERIHDLSKELSYIEALRDRFRSIREVNAKVQVLRRLYSHERSMLDIVDPVARLLTRAVKEYQGIFDQVDAQTGEILAVLKNLDAQVDYIRDVRDDLYRRFMAWSDLLDEWSQTAADRGPEMPSLLRRTYRFLSPRFMQVTEWVLVTKPKKVDGSVQAMLDGETPKKKNAPVMQW